MSTELTVLAYAGLLQFVQYVLMSVPANLELGPGKTLSPRDPDRLGAPLIEQVTPGTGRLFRALNNHFEGLIMFTLAVVVVTLGDKSTAATGMLAWVYLAARIAYIPAYYFGFTPWRSLIWLTGWLATLGMLLLALVI